MPSLMSAIYYLGAGGTWLLARTVLEPAVNSDRSLYDSAFAFVFAVFVWPVDAVVFAGRALVK